MLDIHGHRKIDHWVTLVLRAGMGASISIMVFGLILYILLPDQVSPNLDLSHLPTEILEGNAVAILDLGILVLIATPLSRIFTALTVFLVDREKKFIAVSILVLIILLAAVMLRI